MGNVFHIEINWKRSTENFAHDKFNRDHTIQMSGDQLLRSSAAPDFFGNTDTANPEELIASALSSCHMLTFLVVASKSGYTVDSYADRAESVLDKNAEGKVAITEINLRPVIVFSGDKQPDADQLKSLHEKAHRNCFIANSIKSKVNIL